MNASRQVLLYGGSLLLAGVAASLERSSDLCVMQAATWEEVCRLLAKQSPDAIIFDLANASESHILPLLLKNPTLILIALDPECNQAVLLTGQGARSLTVNQIKQMVGATN